MSGTSTVHETTVPHLATERMPWRSPLLYVGLAMLAVGLGGFLLLWDLDPFQAKAVAVACGTLFLAGKEAAIPLASTYPYAGDPRTIGVALWWLDVAMAFVLYPFVRTAMDGAHRSKGILGSMVRSTRRRAEGRRRLLDRYGGFGLFLFMIVPFGFNGPLVAMVLAILARLRPLATFAAMLAAVTTTTVAWVLLVQQLTALKGYVPPWIPTVIAMSVAAVAIGLSVWDGLKERRRERAALAAKVR